MKYYRDPSSGEVFAYEADGSQDELIPEHLIPLSDKEVSEHLNPVAAPLTREKINAMRRTAYADPMTGSDPLYIEYQRAIALEDPAEQIESARTAWLDRASEIALQYPCP